MLRPDRQGDIRGSQPVPRRILEMANEAQAELAEVLRLSPGLSLTSFEEHLLVPYRDSAVWQRLVDGLRKAGLPE